MDEKERWGMMMRMIWEIGADIGNQEYNSP